VLPIFLALFIASFSLGIAVLILSILSFMRSGRLLFRQFIVFFCAPLLFILHDILRLYEKAFAGVFGGAFPFIGMVLTAAGNGLLGYMLPVIVFRIVNREVTRPRFAVHVIGAAVLVAIGVLDDLFPAPVLPVVNSLALECIQVYAMIILFLNFNRIKNPAVRSFVRVGLVFNSVMIVLALSQLVVKSLPTAPSILREYRLAEVVWYIGADTLLLIYGLRYLFNTEVKLAYSLPEHFVQKYGISPRECEIVSMIVQGYGNRKIGETLFISSLTVKNHVYHIYQKTGATNKIQLINLINSPE
jgi:DNA-binding CsgD family transcriptional regulator